MSLCDLKNDNYYQLIIADLPILNLESKSKLKVFKGTNLTTEQSLPGIPSAVESFFISEHEPKVPGKCAKMSRPDFKHVFQGITRIKI